jgi:hypothetical protein
MVHTEEGSVEEGSSSFLKKRTKKLLSVSAAPGLPIEPNVALRSKSFLVLFFKKELLPSLP